MAVLSKVDKSSKQKAAIYIRVSTHWQIDKDSLKVQERELIAYCTMILGIDDYVVFNDPGYSAKNTDRPKYQEMMERIRIGEFSHLLVWKIDRISRNIIDFTVMSEELKQLGVAFVSKNEQFDSSTAMGEAMLQIVMIFAQFERKQTAERVTAVMLSRANDGQWNGGRVPYGYSWSKEEKTFSIVPEEAKIVRRMAELYEQYQSLLYVARNLNETGVVTKTGREWSPTTVHTILTNPWYIGQYVYNVHSDGKGVEKRDSNEWITVENHHEPILDDEVFYRIKLLLTRNKRGGVPFYKTYIKKNIHVFAGLLCCGQCGSNMTANLGRRRANGFRPSQYACGSRRRKGTSCTNKYTSDTTLGPFVLNYVANIVRASKNSSETTTPEVLERKLLRGEVFKDVASINAEALDQLLNAFCSAGDAVEYRPQIAFSGNDNDIKEIDILRSRRRKLDSALARLNTLYLYGDETMPEKDFVMQRGQITKQLEEVNARIEELQNQESGEDLSDGFINKASYYILANKLIEKRYIDYEKYIRTIDPSIPRSFLQQIIDHIVVNDGRVTSITFKSGATHTFTYKT